MNKLLAGIIIFAVMGCGYTTRGSIYAGQKIIIKPVENKIDITSESRKYANYTSFPILIENKLTNKLVDKFNIDGNLTVVSQDPNALKLTCVINHYNKETLRYTEDEEVEEQRLRLHVNMELTNPKGEVLLRKGVVGESTYYLSGSIRLVSECDNGKWKIGRSGSCIYDTEADANAANSSLSPKSESAAQVDLVDDTARRISEAVIEEW